MKMGARLLGLVLLELVLLGLAAGRVYAQTESRGPTSGPTVQGAYANRAEHWAGSWSAAASR